MPAENCLRFPGAAGAATVLFVPPLFDEANRLRRTLVLTMRALAGLGLASALPDLPGQNDSLIATDAVDLDGWRHALAAFAAALDGSIIVASWRGGALIDDAAPAAGYWRMAPTTGANLLKTMMRARIASEKEAGRTVTANDLRTAARDGPVELGGNMLSAAMLSQLEAGTPAPVTPLRQIALGAGPGTLNGTALWLRAEPGEDAAMARAMATDIHDWARACVAG